MLEIECPWCGPRPESELSYGGEAHITRPLRPADLSDVEWADYLFLRTNPKGLHSERWVCHNCRRWFNARRHTVTHLVNASYPAGESPPESEAGGGPGGGPRGGPSGGGER